MRLLTKVISVIATVAAMAPAAAWAAQEECLRLSHTQVATVTGVQTTSSTTPVQLPGATTQQIFSNDSCVVVEFSALIRAQAPNAVRFTAVSTGEEVGTAYPGSADCVSAGTGYVACTVVFIFRTLSGESDVRIRYRSVNGSPVSVKGGVMKVLYNNEA